MAISGFTQHLIILFSSLEVVDVMPAEQLCHPDEITSSNLSSRSANSPTVVQDPSQASRQTKGQGPAFGSQQNASFGLWTGGVHLTLA